MDVFMEHLVPKKKDSKDKLIIGLIIAGGVVITLLLFAVMLGIAFAVAASGQQNSGGGMIFSIGFLLIAFMWYGAILLINTRSIEYEYIVTNSELDIDKVMSKKGRKHLITIDMKDVTCLARIDDDQYNSVYKNPPQGVRVLNYSAMSQNGYTYFADAVIEGERTIVLFQPTNKMVEALWRFNPKCIHKHRED